MLAIGSVQENAASKTVIWAWYYQHDIIKYVVWPAAESGSSNEGYESEASAGKEAGCQISSSTCVLLCLKKKHKRFVHVVITS